MQRFFNILQQFRKCLIQNQRCLLTVLIVTVIIFFTSVDPLPVELLDQQGASGTFLYDVARIDAPDNELYSGHEAWSYVVTEHYGDQDLVFTGSYSESVGLVHGYLNDGSTVPCGNCDISGNPTMDPDIYNQRAVVAYSDNGTDRFYAWCLRRPGWLLPILGVNGEATYVSVKTDAELNLLHTPPAQDQYCRIPNEPDRTSFTPSIGLSTQNDASPELFTAYIQWEDQMSTTYYLGIKSVDWSTTTGFRPEAPVAILAADAPPTLQVYPNPFTTGFSMALDGGAKGETYTLHIYDMLGRQMYSTEGTLTGINRLLKSQGENWPSGAYYLELRSRVACLTYRQKLVKH